MYCWPAIQSVPVRELPWFGAAYQPMFTVPLPAEPVFTVSHDALLEMVHWQPPFVESHRLPDEPAAVALPLVALSTYGHEADTEPACDTVNVCPATVIVPVCAAPLFGATVQYTWPLPDPEKPEVIVIHEALLLAIQLQPPLLDTQKLPLPPPAATLAVVALSTYGQDGDGAGAGCELPPCETV